MEHDFLDGIDEHFQRLAKLNGNGKRNGKSSSGKTPEDRFTLEILEHLSELSTLEKEEVLKFVQSLKQKAE